MADGDTVPETGIPALDPDVEELWSSRALLLVLILLIGSCRLPFICFGTLNGRGAQFGCRTTSKSEGSSLFMKPLWLSWRVSSL